jgi:FkbM family methyltransferase
MSIDDVISGLEGYPQPFHFPGELRMMNRLAASVAEGVIVAVGSYRGMSDSAMALNAQVPMYCVDARQHSLGEDTPFGDCDRPFWMRNILKAGVAEKVRPINMTSLQAAKCWELPIGLLFIDASHDTDSVRADLTAWLPYVIGGGLVLMHDTQVEAIRSVIDEFPHMVWIEGSDITSAYRTLAHYEYEGVELWVRDGDDRGVLREVHSYTLPDYPVQTIIDAGAHIGAASAYFLQRWPLATVVAIEPEPGNYRVLKENMKDKLWWGMPVQARLAYVDDGDMVLAVHPEHTTCHRIVRRDSAPVGWGVGTAPRRVTLAGLMVEREWYDTLDLLKLDIEGGEVDVIMHESDDVLKRIRFITGEFHAGPETFASGIGARLVSLGFMVSATQDLLAHATFFAVNRGLQS